MIDNKHKTSYSIVQNRSELTLHHIDDMQVRLVQKQLVILLHWAICASKRSFYFMTIGAAIKLFGDLLLQNVSS